MVDIFSFFLDGVSIISSEPLFGSIALFILFMTVIVAILEVIKL